ncbi:MAG: DUF2892 domain-containing protein [Gammaproteobacteria bacterium]|nr:DUF2892 domain-containing protein [Gammaproteobacteria bacterium]MDH5654144.1 DUF2892 domain-containing protein [Gammaproteobacteria bacterium]
MLEKMKIGNAMRLFLLIVAILLWLGIFLTGLKTAHWLLFIPAAFFTFAAVSGICPGMFFSKLITGDK